MKKHLIKLGVESGQRAFYRFCKNGTKRIFQEKLENLPFLILMTEGGENFAGIAVGCQGCAKVIYKSGVLVLLFIWDQDTDHVAGFLVGKSGNIGAAALYPADFLRFLQDCQCSPHGLAADPIAGA